MTVSLPPGNRIVMRRAEKSPIKRPFAPSTCTPGSLDASHALPRSLRSAHQPLASAPISSTSTSDASATATRSPLRRRGGTAGGVAAGALVSSIKT